MDSGATIAAIQEAARAMRVGSDLDAVRAIQAAQDALDAAKADRLRSIEETKAYEADGCSTLNTWVRNQLRLDAKDAATLVRAASTVAQLPSVADAASAGEIRTDHVAAFTYGIKHIGAEVIQQSEPWLLDVAKTCEPLELFKVVRALREAVFPDDLDKAWAEGMDRQDIQVLPVPGGWHLTGFLNVTAGAKFKKVLDSVSAPHDKDDTRSGSQRRVQGLDDLMTRVLESGLPTDKGVRPHMSVIVDVETLHGGSGKPAQLAGFGSVGPQQLGYLTCVSDFTPILTQKPGQFSQARILNVGRSHRAPTLKQRRAVLARQSNICAAPGCNHTHLEIHHTIWWSKRGPTDLDLLIGLCVRCHHLLHRELLNITGNARDGFEFTNKSGLSLQRRRTHFHRAA